MSEVNRSFSNIPETERDNAKDTKEKKVNSNKRRRNEII